MHYTMPFPPTFLCVGSVCGLGPDLLGIHTLSFAALTRTAASSNTLTKGPEKIQAARGYDFASIFALSSDSEEKFWFLPWLMAPQRLSILYVA